MDNEKHFGRISVVEMKMLRWMNGTRVNLEVVPLEDKMKKKNPLR